MTSVATRLLSMIFLFQSRRQWTVSELSDELDVSDRTVHRYIGMLEEMGIPCILSGGLTAASPCCGLTSSRR